MGGPGSGRRSQANTRDKQCNKTNSKSAKPDTSVAPSAKASKRNHNEVTDDTDSSLIDETLAGSQLEQPAQANAEASVNTNTKNNSQTHTQIVSRPKNIKYIEATNKRSWCWKWFKISEDDTWTQCKICKIEYAYYNSTSQMLTHLHTGNLI